MRFPGIFPGKVHTRRRPIRAEPLTQLMDGNILETNVALPYCRRRVCYRLPVCSARAERQPSHLPVLPQVRTQPRLYPAVRLQRKPQPRVGEDQRDVSRRLLKDKRRIFQEKLVDQQLRRKPAGGIGRCFFSVLGRRFYLTREQAGNWVGRLGIRCWLHELDARPQEDYPAKEELAAPERFEIKHEINAFGCHKGSAAAVLLHADRPKLDPHPLPKGERT